MVGTVGGLQREKKFVSKSTLTATRNVKLKLNSKIVGNGRPDEDGQLIIERIQLQRAENLRR